MTGALIVAARMPRLDTDTDWCAGCVSGVVPTMPSFELRCPSFHDVEHRIGRIAVLSAAVLPATPLRTEDVRRHDVLPLDTFGAIGLSSRDVTAAGQVHSSARATD